MHFWDFLECIYFDYCLICSIDYAKMKLSMFAGVLQTSLDLSCEQEPLHFLLTAQPSCLFWPHIFSTIIHGIKGYILDGFIG